jgi:hypothetical protein
LTLANFTKDEIKALYGQHTEATGQVFEEKAILRAWYWSEGQPWLSNALAREAVVEILKNNYSQPVTGELIDQAAETLIIRRDTHIDSLLARLSEPRVRRIMQPIILGADSFEKGYVNDDQQYALDLGLIKRDPDIGYTPANPIYRDVIIRTLTFDIQSASSLERYVKGNKWLDGQTIDMGGLLRAFQVFWREDSGNLPNPYDYYEAQAHLTLQAFLQRVVNGGAHVHREYALGRRSLDLRLVYQGHSYPIEIKRTGERSLEKVREEGLRQLADYMDICGSRTGYLVIFDQRKTSTDWNKKLYWTIDTKFKEGYTIHIVGC